MTANSRELPSILQKPWEPPSQTDTVELVGLYYAIQEGVQRETGASVIVASATQSADVLSITHDLCWAGANLLGKRVLFLNLTDRDAPTFKASAPVPSGAAGPGASPSAPGDTSVSTQLSVENAASERQDVGLYSLAIPSNKDKAVTVQLAGVWMKLQAMFDMILIAVPPVLDDPTAAAMTGLVDGSVLVVANGLSRGRHIARATALLTKSATPLVGVVMVNRTKRKRRRA